MPHRSASGAGREKDTRCRFAASPDHGFTLIELLIVVAILGIVSALAVANLINAHQRARQRRTVADIRSVATAVEAYASDSGYYPKVPSPTVAGLDPYLTPTYIREIPKLDGWGREIGLISDPNGASYTLFSAGAEGLATPLTWKSGPTTSFSDDIVLSSGQYVQWPEGAQQP